MSYGIIYLLTSPSKKCYVGQTTQEFQDRWYCHKADAKRHRTMECRLLNNAIRKYGPDSFAKRILSVAESKEELDGLEKYWIAWLQTANRNLGYNLREGGGTHGKQSEETKQRISEAGMGRIPSEETRARLRMSSLGNKANLGRSFSKEHRQKIGDANRGKAKPPRSEEQCQAISKRMTEYWKMKKEAICQV
jgi:group I intron endonuclease